MKIACFSQPIKSSTYYYIIFSGSEVSFTVQESIDDFVVWITQLCQKVWHLSIAFSSFFLVWSLQQLQGRWIGGSWAQPTDVLQIKLGCDSVTLKLSRICWVQCKTLQLSWTSCTKKISILLSLVAPNHPFVLVIKLQFISRYAWDSTDTI